MAKRQQVTKLLAVMAMVSSTAAAGPHHPHHAQAPKPAPARVDAKPPAAPAPTPARTQRANQDVGQLVFAIFGVTAPRQLANGAPACGNVASRAPRAVDCGRSTRSTK